MRQCFSNKILCGHWRILWMALWDQEFVDLLKPAYIKILNDGSGEFQFGLVRGNFYVKPKNSSFDSTWEGYDDCYKVHGDIYGILDEEGQEGELRGTIAFSEGDESEYRAVRLSASEKDKKL